MSDKELNARIMQHLNKLCYDYCGNMNHIYEALKSKDGALQCKFVYFLYRLIGHHDHMEVEAITCGPRMRAEALALTLDEIERNKPLPLQ